MIEEYVATGQPVGSTLPRRARRSERLALDRAKRARRSSKRAACSRIRTRPRGGCPTEQGYRFYADELLAQQDPRPGVFPLDSPTLRREIDSALEATSEVLSRVTSLLALVSAPPLETTTVRHVEVLLLNPRTVMAVVITSTGGVAKRVVAFDEPVDPGLAKWAGEYLNERVAGLRLGTSRLAPRAGGAEPLRRRSERSSRRSSLTFTDLLQAEQRLYVGRAAGAARRGA